MRDDTIGIDDRARLLALARETLDARVNRRSLPVAPKGGPFDLRRGAFVSIHRRGELRGCLGRLEPEPLSETVVHLAAVVADSDPRFEPVGPSELDEIALEISVLTPEREIASVDEIEVGRHGLIVERGFRRGLLLPQVPVEHQWDRTTFLEHTCVKAGLRRDAWQHGARLFVFEAEVFGD
jgi:AmmeMemoRadiSam system protein A